MSAIGPLTGHNFSLANGPEMRTQFSFFITMTLLDVFTRNSDHAIAIVATCLQFQQLFSLSGYKYKNFHDKHKQLHLNSETVHIAESSNFFKQ